MERRLGDSMLVVLYTSIVSPHQLPLAFAFRRIHPEHDFRYVFTEGLPADATKRGWEWKEQKDWIVDARSNREEVERLLVSADLLLSGIRAVDVFEKRSRQGKVTFYMSERWFKPILGGRFPGWLRMFHLGYRRRVSRILALIKNDSRFVYLPIGKHAEADARRYVPSPVTPFLEWGYYVDSTQGCQHPPHNPLRILWVGRMLNWKRVDTVIKAVKILVDEGIPGGISLTLVGSGPKEARLKQMAGNLPIVFIPGVPIDRVRSLMREHDVYVLSSDGREGWGVALNEAISEGMVALGTREAGSSMSMLPTNCLFHAGDASALAELFKKVAQDGINRVDISNWTPDVAVERLLKKFDEVQNG